LDLLDKKINAKLMKWDPIGVGTFEGFEHNLWVEYLPYIPQLREALEKGKPIKPILDRIEGESIGNFYTSEIRRIQIANELEELYLKNI
jgi:hypothetical protein